MESPHRAELYRSQGRYGEAEPLLVRSLAIFETALGPNHPNTRTVRGNLTALQQKLNGWLSRGAKLRRLALGFNPPAHPTPAETAKHPPNDAPSQPP